MLCLVMSSAKSPSSTNKNNEKQISTRDFLKIGIGVAGGLALSPVIDQLVIKPLVWDKKIQDARAEGRTEGYAAGKDAGFQAGYKSCTQDTMQKLGIKPLNQNGDFLGSNLNQQREHLGAIKTYGNILDEFCLLLLKCVNIRQICREDVGSGIRYLVPNLNGAIVEANKVNYLLSGPNGNDGALNALQKSLDENAVLGSEASIDFGDLAVALKQDKNAIDHWNNDTSHGGRGHLIDNGKRYDGQGTLFYLLKTLAEEKLFFDPMQALVPIAEQANTTVVYTSVLKGGQLYLIRDLQKGVQKFLDTQQGLTNEWNNLFWDPTQEAVRSLIMYENKPQYAASWCEQKGILLHGGTEELKESVGDFSFPVFLLPRYRKAAKTFFDKFSTTDQKNQTVNAIYDILRKDLPADGIMQLQNAIAKMPGYETKIEARIKRMMDLGRLTDFQHLMLAINDRIQESHYGPSSDQFHPLIDPESATSVVPSNYRSLDEVETFKATVRLVKKTLGFDDFYNNALGIQDACAAEDMTYYLGAGQKRGFKGWRDVVSGALKNVGIPTRYIRTTMSGGTRGGLLLYDKNNQPSLVSDWNKDEGLPFNVWTSAVIGGKPFTIQEPYMNSSRVIFYSS
jgi:hypothetical protein